MFRFGFFFSRRSVRPSAMRARHGIFRPHRVSLPALIYFGV